MAPQNGPQAKHWCYTLNNYTRDEERIAENAYTNEAVEYHVFGRETGDSGTKHLQGYIVFEERKRLTQVRAIFPRAHWEKARGKPKQAADYCKKEGDFEEYGSVPAGQGKRTEWDRLRQYVDELGGSRPTQRELWLEFPSLMGRYEHAVDRYLSALLEPPTLTNSSPRAGWQQDLALRLEDDPNDRHIEFLVDEEGGKGKSWFCSYCVQTFPDRVQVLRPAKRDDMAHAINPECDIFLIDVPRSQMEILQYSVLEMLKDRMIFSPKYHSCLKILQKRPHVIVFCNEEPDRTKLSRDRYKVTYLRSLNDLSN